MGRSLKVIKCMACHCHFFGIFSAVSHYSLHFNTESNYNLWQDLLLYYDLWTL